ncbi:hypothetical protein H6G76_30635 [Nostoc sp. FACHB-152]|uniref:hypothetical protein n=1 Tax=unclassified Nostoc TaxID=2593658 RepID=UPI001688A0DD|nr:MULTISPECIES: hypothetical protein [unclassified Nostoc]MBD2451404.1 hypothetical protein [Nostoc sp. FACHB-152]MBD2469390.1 hypothetical protein [Nostoc sp. FACHB-145]
MLNFKIELEKTELTKKLDSFSRGHITLQGKYGIISSKLSTKNYSMMIFISLCELLDGIRLFLINSIQNTYHFVGVGSSFQFFIVKTESNKLRLTGIENKIIDEITELELIENIWREVKLFISTYGHSLDKNEIVKTDLSISIEAFKKQFNL